MLIYSSTKGFMLPENLEFRKFNPEDSLNWEEFATFELL